MTNQEKGSVATVVVISLQTIIIIGLVIFGIWSYLSRQDYKNNTDQKISVAVKVAQQQQMVIDNNNFAVKSQYPLVNYTGPQAYGSLSINYPKTWSAYIDSSGNNYLFDSYFNPGYVVSTSSPNASYALRVQVLNQTYATTLSNLSSQQSGQVTVTPYSLPKIPQVVGVMVTGQVQNNTDGTMVVLPLRSETLQIFTLGTTYDQTFTSVILPKFTFSP